MRGRLRYVGRIVRTRPTTLVAMLSNRTGEPLAPPEWLVRVQEDLHFAWKTVALPASAPPPDLEAPFWVGVMRDKERWAQIVKSVHFFESALDNRAAMKRTVAATLSKACVCSVCDKKFASERALAAPAQTVHGHRTEWSRRVDDSGVCPVCEATFHTRIRVLNHVRSTACRNKVDDFPEEIIERYRKADAAEIHPPALTDGVLQLQEGAQRVMTARCVQVGVARL